MNLLDNVRSAIASLPGVTIHGSEDDPRIAGRQFDLLLIADIKGQTVGLVIEAKLGGYPRDVQNAMFQLHTIKNERRPFPLIPIYAAPAISENSRSLLRSSGIGFWDSGGTLYIELPHALYWVDRPVPNLRPKHRIDIFRGRATQVLHAMLVNPEHHWHIHDLARQAEVSKSTAHQVLVDLEERLWVEKRGRGPEAVRTLRAPGALLDAWAERHSLNDYKLARFHRWTRHANDLIAPLTSTFEKAGTEYALTLNSGAQFVAPYATNGGRLAIVVPDTVDINKISEQVGLKPVDEGENVLIFQSKTRAPLLFRQEKAEVWVASDVQLYLDLWAWPQRGKEQAEHLRAERLAF